MNTEAQYLTVKDRSVLSGPVVMLFGFALAAFKLSSFLSYVNKILVRNVISRIDQLR